MMTRGARRLFGAHVEDVHLATDFQVTNYIEVEVYSKVIVFCAAVDDCWKFNRHVQNWTSLVKHGGTYQLNRNFAAK